MTTEVIEQKMSPGERSTADAMWKGFRCRCPHCGEGQAVQELPEAGRELRALRRMARRPPLRRSAALCHDHDRRPCRRADHPRHRDGLNPWPLWVYFSVFLPGTLIAMLLLMQPVKGAIIGLQWGLRLHGFDARGDYHSQRLPVRGSPGELMNDLSPEALKARLDSETRSRTALTCAPSTPRR